MKCALLTDFIFYNFSENHLSAAVVNMSGGVDSSVTMAILLAAQHKPGSPIKRLLGIAQPIHSTRTLEY